MAPSSPVAMLAERAAAGPLQVILFDGPVEAGWSWSQRDEAMAGRFLAAAPARTPTLAVAGGYHTRTSRPVGWLGRLRADRRTGEQVRYPVWSAGLPRRHCFAVPLARRQRRHWASEGPRRARRAAARPAPA